jgi:very-short-patch-repair endonuclease
MTERKTLNLRPASDDAEAPALKKKGRGWEISESRLDNLHEQARQMRREASEAHKALAARFAKADLGKYTFKRFAVVGSAIVDFNCHNLGMAIVLDEVGGDLTLNRRRDKSLEAVGVKVMHLKAADVLADIDEVLHRVTAGMRSRIADKAEARRKHDAANPRQSKPRYDRAGNGPPRGKK